MILLLPGRKGELTVSFNSTGKNGKQNKVITITSNSVGIFNQVMITATVIEKGKIVIKLFFVDRKMEIKQQAHPAIRKPLQYGVINDQMLMIEIQAKAHKDSH
ncbi:MAG: DUF1573 domain-containing protein [Cytophagales bacterium]|nr:DUF1573 domain-containing protein [Cytophagales bacterium]